MRKVIIVLGFVLVNNSLSVIFLSPISMFLMFCLQESAAVIVALFELNTPEFSMMLTVLPKSFQVMKENVLR